MPDLTTRNITTIPNMFVDDPPPATEEKDTSAKKPSRWGEVFDRIVGTASNILFPNPGSILGSLARGSNDASQMASFQRVMNQSIQHSWNMVQVQKQVQDQSLQVSMISNLLKSRHDGHMAAVQNIKS